MGGSLTAVTGRLPNFLIIGAMRSGTTSLAHYLAGHPDVFFSRPKELHFFDSHYQRGVEWYRAQFAGAGSKRAVGEATPNYLHHAQSIARMAEVVREARLLVVLRDPVDRAYSHYWHNRARGKEPLSFEAALATEDRRLEGDDLDRAWYSYLDRGRYLGQLRRVCEFFPRRALHVLLFEDLRDRPESTYRAACRFLSLDDEPVPASVGIPYNRFVQFRSPTLRRLGKRLPDLARRALGRINMVQATQYPPMEAATRARLAGLFREDNARLADFLGRDLSVWAG